MDYEILTLKKSKLNSAELQQSLAVGNLAEWFAIELTYTSNALEGNTLTRAETANVVEKGITVGGKSLREHLEATNHAKALEHLQEILKRKKKKLTEQDILSIHSIILNGIDNANAGRYRTSPVRVAGSLVVFPNSNKVPTLMESFLTWLNSKPKIHPVKLAEEAHYRLVTIHPFIDGNGRTARLLMNLLLMMAGYPPAIIRKEDRLKYITALEKAQLGGSKESYEKIIFEAVDRSLDICLEHFK